MYVCIYYICIHYVCIYVCVYVFMYVSMYVCMYKVKRLFMPYVSHAVKWRNANKYKLLSFKWHMHQLDMKLQPTNARKCITHFHALMCIIGLDFRKPRNRLPAIIQKYRPAGERNQRRQLKRLLLVWDQSGTTSGRTQWQLYCYYYYCYYRKEIANSVYL